MQFAWDPAKSEANYRIRGFDFEFATLVFEGPILVVEDGRREYGERRFVAIGLADDLHLTVVRIESTESRGPFAGSSRHVGPVDRNEESMTKPSRKVDRPSRGRARLRRLKAMGDAEIAGTAPAELPIFPDSFWEGAAVEVPVPKKAISLRVDEDVLAWFKASGPRYQTRMNAVLRSYVRHHRRGARSARPGRAAARTGGAGRVSGSLPRRARRTATKRRQAPRP